MTMYVAALISLVFGFGIIVLVWCHELQDWFDWLIAVALSAGGLATIVVSLSRLLT